MRTQHEFLEGVKDGGMLTPETWMFSSGLDGETRRVAASAQGESELSESGRNHARSSRERWKAKDRFF